MHVAVHLERPTREPVRAARRGFRSLSNLRLSCCGTADAGQIFRTLSLNRSTIRLKRAKNLPRPRSPSLRTRKLDRLLGRLFPYLVLLRVGFTLPPMLPPTRCALTTPFHPYRPAASGFRRYIFCGTFRRLAPPRCYLAPCPAESGLSSPATCRGSDCPADSRAQSLLQEVGGHTETLGSERVSSSQSPASSRSHDVAP